MDGHIYKVFDQELKELKQRLLSMSELVEKAIRDTTAALLERRDELAEGVINNDDIIDKKENDIDEYCLKLLALRQPAAKDLRFITTAIKINYDLERIADMAANISGRVIVLNREPPLKPYIDLPRMAGIVKQMVRESLDAFVNEDIELARKVTASDEEADILLSRMGNDVLTFMSQDPKTITRGTQLLFVSKYFERMADHAVNIAELVIFMVEGKIIRHQKDAGAE